MQNTHGDFLNLISFNQDIKTKFVYISVKHQSPHFAHELLTQIIDELNEEIRVFDNTLASDSLKFIEEKSVDVSSASFRKTLNELYNSQLHKLMLTEVNDEYAFRIIETPVIPEKKFQPVRSLIAILSLIFGGLMSLFFIIFFKSD